MKTLISFILALALAVSANAASISPAAEKTLSEMLDPSGKIYVWNTNNHAVPPVAPSRMSRIYLDSTTLTMKMSIDGGPYSDLLTALTGGVVAGSDTQVQYNDGGVLGAEAAFTYNKTTDLLTVTNGTLGGALTHGTYDDFTGGSTPSTPSAGHGRLWSTTDQSKTSLSWINEAGLITRIGRDSVIIVRNTSGSPMDKGAVVTYTGSTGSVPTVGLADADTFGLHSEGVMAETVANNGYGMMLTVGRLENINTAGMVEGGLIYLSGTAGTYSQSLPSGAQSAQQIGIVTRAHATQGSIEIAIQSAIDPEVVLDAMGVALTDSSTIDFTYNDTAGTVTAAVTGTIPVTNGGTGTATAFTSGSVVFAGASGVYSQDNSNLFWDDTSNFLGIGTNAPGATLHVFGGQLLVEGDNARALMVEDSVGNVIFRVDTTGTDITARLQATYEFTADASGLYENGVFKSEPIWAPASNSTVTISAIGGNPDTSGSSDLGRVIGGRFRPTHSGSGTLTSMYGVLGAALANSGAGPVTTMDGLYFTTANASSSTVTDMNGIVIDVNKFNSGAVTNAKGLYIRSGFLGVTGTKHGIYIEDGDVDNYFAGPVGIAVSDPTEALSFGGDSARTIWMERRTAANSAGTNLTLQAGGATLSASDKNGGNLVLSSGIPTGSGSSSIFLKTATTGAGSTSDATLTNRWQITGAGSLLASTDNSWDIGAVGATRPRTGYFGTSIITPVGTFATSISTPAATISGMTQGSVLFAGSGGLVSQDNTNLFWDDSQNFLGIQNNSPSTFLTVGSTAEDDDTVAIFNGDGLAVPTNTQGGNVDISGRRNQLINRGASLTLSGNTLDTNNIAQRVFVSFLGRKENSTSANESGYLQIQTNNAGTLTDAMRITSGQLVGIGTTSPTNILSFGGNSARTIWMERHTTADTAGNSLTLQAGGATSGATDKDGGQLILAPGVNTGTGRANVSIKGYTVATASGTGNATQVDRAILGAFKALTDASGIAIVNATVSSNTIASGVVRYAVEVSNGTDLQVEEGQAFYHVINKGGSIANNEVNVISNQALTAGTLTVTWSITAANPAVLTVNADSSLTPSAGFPRITYSLENLTGQAVAIQ